MTEDIISGVRSYNNNMTQTYDSITDYFIGFVVVQASIIIGVLIGDGLVNLFN